MSAQVNIKTSCEHCIFAKNDGLVQIGCEFNRIEKYEKQTEVKLVDNGTKKYYEIDKRICNYCSLPSDFENLTYEESKKKVVENNKVKVGLILKENLETVKDVEYYIKNKLPVEIHIVSNRPNFKTEYSHSNVFYHVILEELTENQLTKQIANKARSCLYVAKSHKKQARHALTKKVLDELEAEINEKLQRLMYVKGHNYVIAHTRGLLSFDGNLRKFRDAVSPKPS